ncbi:MAG TPA: hypothetical protein VMW17_11285 [Candidatus Binatia bacterium]|nr:hypothetical protein [Candidatus Binatia bacterium]
MTGSRPIRVRAYPQLWRCIAGLLVATSRVSLIVIAVGLMTAAAPVSLSVLLQALTIFAAVPAIASWLVARTWTVELERRDDQLVLARAGLRIEIPSGSIERVAPWIIPLPGVGVCFRMQSGRVLPYAFEAEDLTPLLTMLADAGVESARRAAPHPLIVYARAKRLGARRRWFYALGKFGLFPFVPTAVWFYAHQHIAYGALLGQYYLEGLGPFLKTLTVTWGLSAVYLLLYASVWRVVVEAATLLATWLMPTRSMVARRSAETVGAIAYYLGIPVLVTVPFLS